MKRIQKRIIGILGMVMAVLGMSCILHGTASAQPSGSGDMRNMMQPSFASHMPGRMQMPFFAPRYVALGDSVAAGLGLGLLSGPSQEDTACGRSPEAYAYKVGDRINGILEGATFGTVRLETSLAACQQAVISNLTHVQDRDGVIAPAQLDAAFAGGTPALMSLTMGANDLRWAEFIGICASAANCATAQNTDAATAYVQAVRSQLTASLETIRARSSFLPPMVVVTGYYNPVSDACVNNNLTVGEVAWLSDRINDLNSGLQASAQHGGMLTRFAPVDFTGHDICSADTWLQRPGSDPAPFHPTVRGQQAIADAVLGAIGL